MSCVIVVIIKTNVSISSKYKPNDISCFQNILCKDAQKSLLILS